jgi:hypothetical protein
MIPSQSRIEIIRREHEDMVTEALSEDGEDEPYYQYEWMGETHSYTAEGFWLRLLFAVILSSLVVLMFAALGEFGLALIFLLIIGVSALVPILALRRYRRLR